MGRFRRPKSISGTVSPQDMGRFLAKIDFDSETGCWIWNGHKDDGGYGQFRFSGRSVWAHRFSLFVFRGLSSGNHVHHRQPACGNHSCVSPYHLEEMAPSANSREMHERRRERTEEEAPF